MASALVAGLFSLPAQADEAPPPATPAPAVGYPRIGGHLGFAVPIVTISDPVSVIGRDFGTIGLTPGLTVTLSDRWAVDFEFIAFNELSRGDGKATATTFVVDPGVVYNAGPVSAGLRVATQVGAPTNLGLVPILVLPFKVADGTSLYVEGDLPMFVRDTTDGVKPSVGFQLQAGVAF